MDELGLPTSSKMTCASCVCCVVGLRFNVYWFWGSKKGLRTFERSNKPQTADLLNVSIANENP